MAVDVGVKEFVLVLLENKELGAADWLMGLVHSGVILIINMSTL